MHAMTRDGDCNGGGGIRRRFLFICGLHKSGTSLLHDALRGHPEISGFFGAGVPRNEGQHLQSVMPPAYALGGPGEFGFCRDSHLTEGSSIASIDTARQLYQEWSPYWDLSKTILMEKSPPNLLRTRFLQALFPNSQFLVILRHPIAVALATQKWRKHISLSRLIEHWLRCHEIFETDLPFLRQVMQIRFEELLLSPRRTLDDIRDFLRLDSMDCLIPNGVSTHGPYAELWNAMPQRYRAQLSELFRDRVHFHGYPFHLSD